MSSIVSRWVVREEYEVGPDDVGPDGVVTDGAIERWISETRDAYLECCTVLRETAARSGLRLQFGPALWSGGDFGRPSTVVVSAGTREVYPTSFTMAFRLRTFGGADEIAVNATCAVALADPVTCEERELGDAVRDELIALEHAARHVN